MDFVNISVLMIGVIIVVDMKYVSYIFYISISDSGLTLGGDKFYMFGCLLTSHRDDTRVKVPTSLLDILGVLSCRVVQLYYIGFVLIVLESSFCGYSPELGGIFHKSYRYGFFILQLLTSCKYCVGMTLMDNFEFCCFRI